jgi:hypothetical protein
MNTIKVYDILNGIVIPDLSKIVINYIHAKKRKREIVYSLYMWDYSFPSTTKTLVGTYSTKEDAYRDGLFELEKIYRFSDNMMRIAKDRLNDANSYYNQKDEVSLQIDECVLNVNLRERKRRKCHK